MVLFPMALNGTTPNHPIFLLTYLGVEASGQMNPIRGSVLGLERGVGETTTSMFPIWRNSFAPRHQWYGEDLPLIYDLARRVDLQVLT